MQEISTDVLNQNVRKGLTLNWSTQAILFCAIIIACIGLNTNSAPIVIGAMLISPLMGPIVGIGYALGNSNSGLLSRGARLFAAQFIIAVTGATIYFFISPLNAATDQLLARTEPTLWDVLIAFFGGFAGVISSAKKDGGNVVPGVAIATALMPPLCTIGYGISHLNWPFVWGAGYLFLINAFFIALATAVGTIFFRIRSGERLNVSVKQEVIVLIVAIIVIIPSSISAYSIVQKSYVTAQLSQFVEDKLPDQYIAQQSVTGKTIQLTVIGTHLSDQKVKSLDRSLKVYHLDHYALSIKQLTRGNYITAKEFQDYMKQNNLQTTPAVNSQTPENKSLNQVQSDLVKQYPRQITNVLTGEVVDKANHKRQLIAIQLTSRGQKSRATIQATANKLAKANDVDAVIQFVQS